MNEAVAAARALAREPDVFLPDQFSNPANPEAHRTGTGPEILAALDGKVDVLVAGVGTGGTITGAGEVIKAANPKALVVAVEPESSAVLSGRAPGPASHPGHRRGLRARRCSTARSSTRSIAVRDEAAIETARRGGGARGRDGRALVRRRAVGALQVAARPESKGKRIVVVLPDSGERYISAPFFAPPG